MVIRAILGSASSRGCGGGGSSVDGIGGGCGGEIGSMGVGVSGKGGCLVIGYKFKKHKLSRNGRIVQNCIVTISFEYKPKKLKLIAKANKGSKTQESILLFHIILAK